MAVIRRAGRRPGGGERARRRYTLVLLVLSALTLLTLDVRGFAPLQAVRSAALAVFAPVGSVASAAFRPVGDAWSGAVQGGDLKRENDELHRRVEELEGQVVQRDTAQVELERLKDALDLPYAGSMERVTAQVTAGAVADFDATIEIDKGSDAGIARGMPVVVGTGLVGSVAQVSGGRAVVRLVSDRSSRVGVGIAGRAATGAGHGLVEGQGAGPRARAGSFDVAADLPDGALLVTAGTPGSLYPPGIPVGTAEHVAVDGATPQKVADVRLAARLDDLSFVTVLLYRAP
jgi:rod shape-determining protein MreC